MRAAAQSGSRGRLAPNPHTTSRTITDPYRKSTRGSEVGEGLVGPSQFRSSKGKPQELTVIGLDHSALLLIDREFQLAGEVPRNTGPDAFTGARALDKDKQVIGIPGKPVSTPFQFLVEVIQEDVGEQRGERTTLRRAKLRCLDDVPHQHTRPQVAAYQAKKAFIPHLPGHAGYAG